MASSAPNKPSELEAEYQGELRSADGYQYWTTSSDDEDTVDFTDMAARTGLKPTMPAPEKKKTRLPRVARLFGRALIVAIILLLIYFLVSAVQVYFAADRDDLESADAIVVLGAAQLNCEPSPVFRARLDHAFSLWNTERGAEILTTGSKLDGDNCTEGITGYNYLRGLGVPESDLVTIVDGKNTYEQLLASANQMQERNLASALLVSDRYHNYRLLDIADAVGIDAFVSPSTVEPNLQNYAREGVAVSLGRVLGYRRLSSLTD